MVRFVVAAAIAALVSLGSDRYAGDAFFTLGSLLTFDDRYDLIATNHIYKAFTWACMFAAALVVVPAPRRNWPTALVCGLALAVGLYQARELTLLTVANGQSIIFGWIAALVVFALPLWLTWEWYRRIMPRLAAAPERST